MSRDELRDRYLAAMNQYLDEVSKTRTLVFQTDPAVYTAQQQRERDAKHEYHEAKRAFSEAPCGEPGPDKRGY